MRGKTSKAKRNSAKNVNSNSVDMAGSFDGSNGTADLLNNGANGFSERCELNGHVDSSDFVPGADQTVDGPGGNTELADLASGETSTIGDPLPPERRNRSHLAEAMLADGEKPIGLKLAIPGADLMDVQMGFNELVQELQQILMDGEDTCHRTCFTLKFGDKYLNSYMEIRHIEGLVEGSILRVVEEPYTLRQARIHVRHVRDLLRVPDTTESFLGSDGLSPTYVDKILEFQPSERKRVGKGQVDCTPPDYIMPNSEVRPMMALYNVANEKPIKCVKLITLTCWNPPPGPRKMKGDILYLFVLTVENKGFHITCCPRGFYVNLSTDDTFNPTPASPHIVCHSLVDLLMQISPGFKRNYGSLRLRRRQRHVFERVSLPFQVYSWFSPVVDHTNDYIRAEDWYMNRLGYEDLLPGQARDWNEEVQSSREMPRKTLLDRLTRSRALFKVYGDFVSAAVRGAVNVINNNVVSINPCEEPKMRMFLWNNIFFSLGFDIKDHYKTLGGDAAAFVSPLCDLHGVQAYFDADPETLCVLATTVVEYKGYRITCQSVIPGILDKDQEQEQCILYGSVDFGATVFSSDKFDQLLEATAAEMHILPHKVQSENGDVVAIKTAAESKGIIGNDGRCYILDLYRHFPSDPHYIEGAEVSDFAKACGFPRKHPHVLAYLRPELVDAFIKSKTSTFIELLSYHFKKFREESGNGNEKMSWIFFSKKNNTLSIADLVSCIATADGSITDLSEEMVNEAEKATDTADMVDSAEENGLMVEEYGLVANEEVSKQPKETTACCDVSTAGKENSSFTQGKEEDQIDGDDCGVMLDCCRKKLSTKPRKPLGVIDAETVAKRSTPDNPDVLRVRNAFRCAAVTVGSCKKNEFDIRFNIDCYSPVVKHVSEDGELEQQKGLHVALADYLLTVQIPKFVEDCAEHSLPPFDSQTVTDILHSRGIGMRYLGYVAKKLGERPTLQYWQKHCLSTIVIRCAKHSFRNYLQNVGPSLMAAAVAHFLNCFLSSDVIPTITCSDDAPVRRKTKKRNRASHADHKLPPESAEWSKLTSKGLWQEICNDAHSYYAYPLKEDSVSDFCEAHKVQKFSLLRSLCLTVGVQVKLRDYDLSLRCKPPFVEDDIMNMYPLVRRLHFKAADAANSYEAAVRKLEAGQLNVGLELLNEAAQLYGNIYGSIHPEIIKCLRLIARVLFTMNDYTGALLNQHKAVVMTERCFGIDSAHLISDYLCMAVYSFASGKIPTAMKLLYRSRYLVLMLNGEDHPEMALIDSNIGLMLYAVGELDFSMQFLQNALMTNQRFFGDDHLKTALTYDLLARTYSCRNDYRSALINEKHTFFIYRKLLGENHERTKASESYLQELTDQAVNLQRRMNAMRRNNSSAIARLCALEVHYPEAISVIEVLTIINGMYWVFAK
uniref:Clu domain-containing protein n=1 Tax=Trichuris muris TaxID=70415 RepID=A0A5S6QJU7_TRIMR